MTEVNIKDWLTQKIKKDSKEENELVVKQQVKKKRRRTTDGNDKKVGTKLPNPNINRLISQIG